MRRATRVDHAVPPPGAGGRGTPLSFSAQRVGVDQRERRAASRRVAGDARERARERLAAAQRERRVERALAVLGAISMWTDSVAPGSAARQP